MNYSATDKNAPPIFTLKKTPANNYPIYPMLKFALVAAAAQLRDCTFRLGRAKKPQFIRTSAELAGKIAEESVVISQITGAIDVNASWMQMYELVTEFVNAADHILVVNSLQDSTNTSKIRAIYHYMTTILQSAADFDWLAMDANALDYKFVETYTSHWLNSISNLGHLQDEDTLRDTLEKMPSKRDLAVIFATPRETLLQRVIFAMATLAPGGTAMVQLCDDTHTSVEKLHEDINVVATYAFAQQFEEVYMVVPFIRAEKTAAANIFIIGKKYTGRNDIRQFYGKKTGSFFSASDILPEFVRQYKAAIIASETEPNYTEQNFETWYMNTPIKLAMSSL